MATEYTQKDSFITFYPITNVNVIKVSQDITNTRGVSEFYLAMQSATTSGKRESMTKTDIMLTAYTDNTTDATYFPPSNSALDNASIIYAVYRKTPDDLYYKYLHTLKNGVFSMKDYNIKSSHYYHYMMTVEKQEVNSKTLEKIISYDIYENSDEDGYNNYYRPLFNNWSICTIEPTTTGDNIYTKTGKTWYLGLNIEGESIAKNLNVVTLNTLSKYPKVTIGKQNYDSMSFTGLLGKIYEYSNYDFVGEGNVENASKISQNVYRYTEKMDTYNVESGSWGIHNKYATEMDKLEAWKDFITDGELKLIKDLKGNSWIIQIADSSEYQIENSSNLGQTRISFNWVEVMDSSKISIITEGE